jgi:hypothetical protein
MNEFPLKKEVGIISKIHIPQETTYRLMNVSLTAIIHRLTLIYLVAH